MVEQVRYDEVVLDSGLRRYDVGGSGWWCKFGMTRWFWIAAFAGMTRWLWMVDQVRYDGLTEEFVLKILKFLKKSQGRNL